jgi:hypothetical protein
MPPSTAKRDEQAPPGDHGNRSDARVDGVPLERAFEELLDAGRQLQILAEVRTERARLRLRRRMASWMAEAGAGFAIFLLVAIGGALVVIGLVGRFRALFADLPGMGDLLAGALLLATALAWGIARRVRSERSLLRRLESKHGGDQADLRRRDRSGSAQAR